MRDNELYSGTDGAVCPNIALLGSAPKRINPSASPSIKEFVPRRSCGVPAAGMDADRHVAVSRDKPVIAPAVFVFQKTPPTQKRWAEDGEEGADLGAVASKRRRSLTFPSVRPRCRKGYERRTRTSSISFPTPASGFPPVQQRMLLRPTTLPAPQPWSSPYQPSLPEMGLGPSEQAVVEMGWDSSARTVPLMPCDPRILRDKIPFVFGENMSERVLSPSKCSEDSSVSSSDCSDSELSDENPSYPTYTAAHRGRCLLKHIQVVTGEEQESNVVQLTCKLFVLERRTQSWSERGRGILRLNDMVTGSQGRLQSRLVMRHQGTLKLILNSRLWPHTQVRRAARRSLQVTASDLESHTLRVFLVQASARDAARLYVAIHHRLVALRSQHRDVEDDDGEDATKPGQAEKQEEDVTRVPQSVGLHLRPTLTELPSINEAVVQ
ncbi:ran-binding protein 3-like isoform X2 [Paramormyrops kingsleyae]|uniref:ran-binding protein 3-like isoform X2 n=1 Tax=Paramormyrops kingsleyae TaxID=1676925 RepID=UPI000CD5EA04|nr:ran-binding protein 3-like isoform X2 [Paramormyrops kingsleyae]